MSEFNKTGISSLIISFLQVKFRYFYFLFILRMEVHMSALVINKKMTHKIYDNIEWDWDTGL